MKWRAINQHRFYRKDCRDWLAKDAAISYHLAPPMLAWLKARDGSPRKIRFGRWLTPYLRGLARLSWLRDSWADPFGYATDRRAERAYRDTGH